MAYKYWLSLVLWSSFLIIPFTSPSGYCLSLDNDLRARGLFGSAMKQRRGKGGQRRGPARTVRHSRRCFQTRSSPKEWDSQSNFILTFNHITRRFLLLGVNFLAPARGPGRISHNTFRKRLGHRNGDTGCWKMAAASWSHRAKDVGRVLSASAKVGPWCPRVPERAFSPLHPRQNQERTLPTLGPMEEREKGAKGLLTLSKGSLTLELLCFSRNLAELCRVNRITALLLNSLWWWEYSTAGLFSALAHSPTWAVEHLNVTELHFYFYLNHFE